MAPGAKDEQQAREQFLNSVFPLKISKSPICLAGNMQPSEDAAAALGSRVVTAAFLAPPAMVPSSPLHSSLSLLSVSCAETFQQGQVVQQL